MANSSPLTRLRSGLLAGLASGIPFASVGLYNSWETTGKQFWMPAAILVGLMALALWSLKGMAGSPVETSEPPTRDLFATVTLAGVSIFLFCVVALMFQVTYRKSVNPHVIGHVERTWIVPSSHGRHMRAADIAFSGSHAGRPINCEAHSMGVADGAQVGDTIELSPVPGTCERPYVIDDDPQLEELVFGVISAVVAAAAIFFAVLAWGASNPQSKIGSWPTGRPARFS